MSVRVRKQNGPGTVVWGCALQSGGRERPLKVVTWWLRPGRQEGTSAQRPGGRALGRGDATP